MMKLRTNLFSASLIAGSLIASTALSAPPEGKGGGGRGENYFGILSVLRDDLTVPGGLYSDDPANPRYYPPDLNGVDDPDNPGTDLDDGDCVLVVTPAADGVDKGKIILFAPFGPNDCTIPGPIRRLGVVGSDNDLDGDESVSATDPELINTRFACNEVFIKNAPIPGGMTSTDCALEVRKYDPDDEFERTWIIEWPAVDVTHHEPDLRQIDSDTAEVFELVPPPSGKGKKDKQSRGFKSLAFRIQIRRVAAP